MKNKELAERHKATIADALQKHLVATNSTLPIGVDFAKICAVYLIESPIGKKYVGASVNIRKRWNEYSAMSKSVERQLKLHASFMEYGVNNHTFTIIEICAPECLKDREAYWGMVHDVIHVGLNSCLGKSQHNYPTRCPNTLKKMRSHARGNTLTDEKKAELKAQRQGVPIPRERAEKIGAAHRGMKRSIEAKANMSRSRKRYMQSLTPEERRVNTKGQMKMVIHLESGIFYDCIRDAAVAYNLGRKSLGKALLGKSMPWAYKKSLFPFAFA